MVYFCSIYQHQDARISWNSKIDTWKKCDRCGKADTSRVVIIFTKYDLFARRFQQNKCSNTLSLPEDYTGTCTHPEECARGVAMHFLQSTVDIFGKSRQRAIVTNLTDLRHFDQLLDSIHLSANPDQTQFHVEMCISMPWCYVRLLLLARHMHNRSNKRCYLGRVPLDIIKMIAHFL